MHDVQEVSCVTILRASHQKTCTSSCHSVTIERHYTCSKYVMCASACNLCGWSRWERNNRSKMLRLSHAKRAQQQKENYLLIMHLINANIHLYTSLRAHTSPRDVKIVELRSKCRLMQCCENGCAQLCLLPLEKLKCHNFNRRTHRTNSNQFP